MLIEALKDLLAALYLITPLTVPMVDFLVKAFLLLGLTAAVAFLFDRRLASSSKHLLWTNCLYCMALIPFLPAMTGSLARNGVVSEPASLIGVTVTPVSVSTLTAPENFMPAASPSPDPQVFFWLALALPAVFLLMRLALSAYRVMTLSREAEVQSSLERVVNVSRLKRRLGITRNVVFKFSDSLSGPISFGLFRPEIIFPTSARHWEPAVFESALLHELSHISRLDWLTSTLGYVVASLYWFNPSGWYALHKINSEAENSCDSEVLQSGRDGTQYSQDLLTIARSCSRFGRADLVIQEMVRHKTLQGRIRDLLGGRTSTSRGSALVLPMLGMFALVTLSASGIGKFVHVSIEQNLSAEIANLYAKGVEKLQWPVLENNYTRAGNTKTNHPVMEPALAAVSPPSELAAPIKSPLSPDSRALTPRNAVKNEIEYVGLEVDAPERPDLNVLNQDPVDTSPDPDTPASDSLQISFGEKGTASHHEIVIDDLSRTELVAEIKRVQDEFYRVFNAYEDRKELTIRCHYYVRAGSFIPQRACEPQFLQSARSESLSESLKLSDVAESGIIQSRVNLLSSTKSEFEALTAAMNEQIKVDPYFRELNQVLRALRARLQELEA